MQIYLNKIKESWVVDRFKSEWYEFSANDDYKSIRIKVYKEGCILAGKVLRFIIDNDIKPIDLKPQDEKNANYWDPIPEAKFKRMQEIIHNKKYFYQRQKEV